MIIFYIVKYDENKIENPNVSPRLFDRIYFSTITACLLGYGDIYPATNMTKLLSTLRISFIKIDFFYSFLAIQIY